MLSILTVYITSKMIFYQAQLENFCVTGRGIFVLHVKTTEKQIITQYYNMLIYSEFDLISTHIAVDTAFCN